MLERMKGALTQWAQKAGRGFVDETDAAFVWEDKMTKTVAIDVDRESEKGPKFLNIEGRFIELLRPFVSDASIILSGGSIVEDNTTGFITAIRGAPASMLNVCLNELWRAGYNLISRTIDHQLITKVEDTVEGLGGIGSATTAQTGPLSQSRACSKLF